MSVCHSVRVGVGPNVTITRDALDLTVQVLSGLGLSQTWGLGPLAPYSWTSDLVPPTPSHIRPGIPQLHPTLLTSGGHHWIPFLNLFILGYDWATSGGGHWSYYVCKRVLRILLECFLVLRYLFSWKDPWFKVNRNTSKAVIKYLRPYCRK